MNCKVKHFDDMERNGQSKVGAVEIQPICARTTLLLPTESSALSSCTVHL